MGNSILAWYLIYKLTLWIKPSLFRFNLKWALTWFANKINWLFQLAENPTGFLPYLLGSESATVYTKIIQKCFKSAFHSEGRAWKSWCKNPFLSQRCQKVGETEAKVNLFFIYSIVNSFQLGQERAVGGIVSSSRGTWENRGSDVMVLPEEWKNVLHYQDVSYLGGVSGVLLAMKRVIEHATTPSIYLGFFI